MRIGSGLPKGPCASDAAAAAWLWLRCSFPSCGVPGAAGSASPASCWRAAAASGSAGPPSPQPVLVPGFAAAACRSAVCSCGPHTPFIWTGAPASPPAIAAVDVLAVSSVLTVPMLPGGQLGAAAAAAICRDSCWLAAELAAGWLRVASPSASWSPPSGHCRRPNTSAGAADSLNSLSGACAAANGSAAATASLSHGNAVPVPQLPIS